MDATTAIGDNGGELAALFCWSFLLVAALGSGPWSLDAALARRQPVERAEALSRA